MRMLIGARTAMAQACGPHRSVGEISDPVDGMVTVEVLDAADLADRLYGPEPEATDARRKTRERCARRQMTRWGVRHIIGVTGLNGRRLWASDLAQAAIDDPERNVSRRRPTRSTDGGGPGNGDPGPPPS